VHQGVRIVPGDEPIPNLKSLARTGTLAELEQELLRDANALHASTRGGDLNLAARTSSFDIAQGMMKAAPEAFDLARESAGTLADYGASAAERTSFAAQCLTARRLIERGVRTVEIIDTGASNNWDSHGNMQDHRPKAQRVDQPLAALIRDLKQRELLERTVVLCMGEFGRTPRMNPAAGRDHWPNGFSLAIAGGGIRGGRVIGESDPDGIKDPVQPVAVANIHATVLTALGLEPDKENISPVKRPIKLSEGRVISALLET